MRKYTRIGTFLLALVMCLTMLTAQAESELPEEVADLFTVKAWAHYAIANQPDMPENKAFAVMQEESGYEAALLVMRNTKSETNVLVLAEKSSAQADWKITMRNWGAVGQGDANVPQLAVLADGRFVIHYPNGDSAYFTHEANGWQLTNLSFGDTTQVEVTRSGMTFLTLSDNGKWVKTSVSGVVETAMAQFSMDRFPRTVAAAREHLTNPPTIPDSPWSWTYPYGFPQPSQYAKLAAGKQYAVYSAPSDTSFRAANGKALLSTNDWVQVFFEEDGYLRRSLEAIADDIAFTQGVDVSVEHLERLLSIIHELEPTGVGARNLQECLLLQLDQENLNTRSRRLARKIVECYFDEFVKKHYEKLMARLQVSEDEFREAIEEITRLSPKPGNLYSEGGADTTPYVTPDFILDYHEGHFDLTLNSGNLPEARINHRYIEMMRGMVDSDGRVKEKDREAIQFVKSKIDSAKWFISAIKQRHDTLMRTMQEILDYQQEYFKDGNKSKLRPMILKDIADRTGLDVSTISRVVNSKYVQTQFGIILLKSLFSEAMQTDSGEEVSSYEIKNILQQCIDEEDKRKPLTDETLMDILNSKGYRIARRTVAKYREMLSIPVARLRKQI